SGRQLATRLALGAFAGLGLVILASYVLPDIRIGRGVFALHALAALPALVLWRRVVFRTLREEALRPRAVVLGEPAVARKIARALSRATLGGAEVVGVVVPPGGATEPEAPAGEAPVLGTYGDLLRIIEEGRVGRAIVVDGKHDRHL